MHSYYFDGQPQHQQQFYAPPGSGGYEPQPQLYPPQLNLDVPYDAYDPGLDQQLPSSLSSASPLTPHGAIDYATVGGGPGFQYGFQAPAQVGPAHDPLPPPLYPPPALGSSEHAFAYPPHQESFYPVQPQYRAPSPSSSSLWRALEMPAAASNSVGPAPRSAPASALSKSSLSPLRIATPRQHLPAEDSPLTPGSPEPFFGQRPMQWQTPISAPSMAPKPLARSSSTRSPVKRAPSSDRKPVMACLFCRGRKIACGGPLNPDSENKTCNQCARRNLKCSYPAESHRGLRRTRNKSDAAPPAHEVPVFSVAPILAAPPHLQ